MISDLVVLVLETGDHILLSLITPTIFLRENAISSSVTLNTLRDKGLRIWNLRFLTICYKKFNIPLTSLDSLSMNRAVDNFLRVIEK